MKFLLPRSSKTGGAISLAVALSTFLLPALSLHAQSSQVALQMTRPEPEQKSQVGSCPIRVDEAYLTANPAPLPAEASDARRTLHVTLVDASGKQIVSYVVHARVDQRPNGSMTNVPPTSTISRKWHGTLEPDTPTNQEWSFSADRTALGLRRVWFDKVTFADGSIWNKTANDSCSYAATGHVVQTKSSPKTP